MLSSLLKQALVFFLLFYGISTFKETNMLSTGTEVAISSAKLATLAYDSITLGQSSKPKLLYFFAPWCQICHLSIRNLQSIYESNPNIDVIAIALDFENKQQVINFVSQHQLSFPIALGDKQIKAQFSIVGYPSYYVLDSNNIITAKSMGYSTELGLMIRTL